MKITFEQCHVQVDSSYRSILLYMYTFHAERLYIIVDGVVVYKGGYGPFDYKLWEVQDWLAARYGMRGASLKKV